MGGALVVPARAGWVLWPVLAWLLATPAGARAEVPFEVPPAPREVPSRWAFEVHLDGVTTLDTSGLCPDPYACVYGGGAGLGATAERRRPTGLGFFVGYDAWFIDSASVYELAVQQAARGGVRFTWPNATIAHPIVEVSGGISGFGDTFLVESFGVLVQGMLGLEIELSRHFGVQGGFGMRAFSHTRFTTDRDNVRRGRGEPFSETLFFQIGLTINGRPWAAAEP